MAFYVLTKAYLIVYDGFKQKKKRRFLLHRVINVLCMLLPAL